MTAPVNFYADFKGLAALKNAAGKEDGQALREAARQFESLFTQMMLKSMRQASTAISGGDSLMDNDQSDMYREMADNQMAMQLSKGRGLGLADMLVRQLTQQSTQQSTQQPIKNGAVGAQPGSNQDNVSRTQKIDFATRTPRDAVFKIHPEADSMQFVPASLPYLQTPAPASKGPAVSLAPEVQSQDQESTPISAAPVQDVKRLQLLALQPSALQPLAKDAADFVRQLWPHAQKAARELGVDAKTLIAHAALETGWGKFVPCNPDGSCSFNLFGIKATSKWQGLSTAVNTLEYQGGIAVKRRENFRAYESPAASFRDYASLIKNNPRYAAAVGVGGDAGAFASALQQGGYATDPNYAAKLTATAARLSSMDPASSVKLGALKIADNQPLNAGSSVSAGDKT